MELNWSLLVILIVISALVSYVGDIVGMRVSRKRVTLMGIRPRYTTSIITIATGVIITIITLGVLSTASETVRTALTGMKELNRQLQYLSDQVRDRGKELDKARSELDESRKNLAAMKADYDKLRDETNSLKKQRESLQQDVDRYGEMARKLYAGLAVVREGDILFRAHQLIEQEIMPKGLPVSEIESRMKKILEDTAKMAEERGAKPWKQDGETVVIMPESWQDALSKISSSDTDSVIRLVSVANSVKGEPVLVSFSVHPNVKIYSKGAILLSSDMDGGQAQEEIEKNLYLLLQKVNSKAVEDGVLPDPLHHTVGSLSASTFYDWIEKISAIKGRVNVKIMAEDDIFTMGPVKVKLEVGSVN